MIEKKLDNISVEFTFEFKIALRDLKDSNFLLKTGE